MWSTNAVLQACRARAAVMASVRLVTSSCLKIVLRWLC
jgi:hypothetical protein